MAKTKVEQYVFQPGIPVTDNRYGMAHDLIKNNVEFICDETAAWIAEQVKMEPTYPNAYAQIIANKEFVADEVMAWFDSTYPGVHTPERHEKCERDTRYNIDAIAYDLNTGGNSKCIEYAKKYWEGTNSNLANSSEQTYALALARFE